MLQYPTGRPNGPHESNDAPPATSESFLVPSIAARRSSRTLARPAMVRGIGFVTGTPVTVRFCPAPAGTGIVFVRSDLPDRIAIPATIGHVMPRSRRTAIANRHAVIEMTEHALAVLAGLGIDHCRIELDAGELPGMDGSALAFLDAILAAGIMDLPEPVEPIVIDEPLVERDQDATLAIVPAPPGEFLITFSLSYPRIAGIGEQCRTLRVTEPTFRSEIAPARTFILESEIQSLVQQGLGNGVTFQDLLVFDDQGEPIGNALRFVDECVRHKILDILGDLALLGRPIAGHVFAHKSGHQLNTRLARRIADRLRNLEDHPRPIGGRPHTGAAHSLREAG